MQEGKECVERARAAPKRQSHDSAGAMPAAIVACVLDAARRAYLTSFQYSLFSHQAVAMNSAMNSMTQMPSVERVRAVGSAM